MADEDRGRANALAWMKNIVEMVDRLEAAQKLMPHRYGREEAARDAITESVLSVEVRGPWHVPGDIAGVGSTDYRILLTTGGPAAQIVGDLDEYSEPETANLQHQDWFTPWTTLPINDDEQAALLTFARCFYFGG